MAASKALCIVSTCIILERAMRALSISTGSAVTSFRLRNNRWLNVCNIDILCRSALDLKYQLQPIACCQLAIMKLLSGSERDTTTVESSVNSGVQRDLQASQVALLSRERISGP